MYSRITVLLALFSVLVTATKPPTANGEITRVRWTESCVEMRDGDQKVVNISQFESKIHMPVHYTLIKTGQKSYDVYFRLKFHYGSKFKSQYKKLNPNFGDYNSYYRDKVAKCYESYGKNMRDELGRTISFKLFDSPKSGGIIAPGYFDVVVMGENFRSTSEFYGFSLSCRGLIHEAFHYAGLVDEYPEKVIRNWNGGIRFQGRSIGPTDSPMYNNTNTPYSGHLNAILFPNCTSQNELYFRCAKSAYDDRVKSPYPECQNASWVKR